MWGLVIGSVQAASPLAFWWLDPATVHRSSITVIAAIYVGFAVADGRPKVLAMEAAVAGAFVVFAAAGVTDPRGSWCLATPDTASRTCGRSAITTSPTHVGGRRSVRRWTSWWPP